MKIFKIRNADGLFSTGGSTPNFTKNGKSWSTLGHVNSHLGFSSSHKEELYKDCDIVAFETHISSVYPVSELIEGKVSKKNYAKVTKKSEYKDNLNLLLATVQDLGIEVDSVKEKTQGLTVSLGYLGVSPILDVSFSSANKVDFCSLNLINDDVSILSQKMVVSDWSKNDFLVLNSLTNQIKSVVEFVAER